MADMDIDGMLAHFNEVVAASSDQESANAETRLGGGKTLIRMFPPPPDMTWVFIESLVHWSVGPERKRRIFCLRNWGGQCPICDKVNTLYDSQDQSDKDYAGKLRANKKYILLVVNRDKPDEGPRILLAAKTIWEGIMVDYLRKPVALILHDPVNGFDVSISKVTTKKITKYIVTREPDREPICDPEQLLIWLNEALPNGFGS